MIKLYQFTDNPNKPDVSPFSIKVHMFMKVNNIEHEVCIGDVRKAPKKKLPYLQDGDAFVSDSDDMIHYLSKKFEIDMTQNLTAQQKGYSFGLRKMLNEYLYFIVLYARWVDDEGWRNTWQIFSKMPLFLRFFISKIARPQLKKTVYNQGIGRHSREEIITMGKEVFDSLSKALGEQKFFFGNEISLLDITAYSFLTQILNYESFATEELKKFENLVAYEKHLTEKYYS